jgi:hypothetical protein
MVDVAVTPCNPHYSTTTTTDTARVLLLTVYVSVLNGNTCEKQRANLQTLAAVAGWEHYDLE